MLTPCVERYIERMKESHKKHTKACVRHFKSSTQANKRACKAACAEHTFNEYAAWWMDMHESNVEPARLYYMHENLFSSEVKTRMHDHKFKSIGDKATEFLDKYASFQADPSDENALDCAMFPVGKAAMEDLERDHIMSPSLKAAVDDFAAFLVRSSE